MPARRWTYSVPPDLHPRLEAALAAKYHGLAEVRAAVTEWMVEQDITVPESVHLSPPPEDDVVIHRR